MPVKQQTNKNGNGKHLWKPGESGNPKGRPKKGHTFRDLLNEQLDKKAFAKRVIEMAMEGHSTALREVLERIDGKVTQSIAAPADVPSNIVVRFVSPGDSKHS